jgi:hypothetical protein
VENGSHHSSSGLCVCIPAPIPRAEGSRTSQVVPCSHASGSPATISLTHPLSHISLPQPLPMVLSLVPQSRLSPQKNLRALQLGISRAPTPLSQGLFLSMARSFQHTWALQMCNPGFLPVHHQHFGAGNPLWRWEDCPRYCRMSGWISSLYTRVSRNLDVPRQSQQPNMSLDTATPLRKGPLVRATGLDSAGLLNPLDLLDST